MELYRRFTINILVVMVCRGAKISDIKISKKGKNQIDRYTVSGGPFKTMHIGSQPQVRAVAGARRRILIKRALRCVGIKTFPKSLTKMTRGI